MGNKNMGRLFKYIDDIMAKKNFGNGRGSGRSQTPGRGRGRGRGSNRGRQPRWMYNHEREYIVRIWSYLSMTAREEMLNMLLGMLGGNPSAAIGPDGRLSSLLPSDCQPIVAESNAQSKTEKTKGKPPKVNSWDRDILRDLTGVSAFGNLTSAQRAKDPEATLRLLSTASGTIARGKRNFNLTDGEITRGINQLLKDDGTWNIPAMKALYQKPENRLMGEEKKVTNRVRIRLIMSTLVEVSILIVIKMTWSWKPRNLGSLLPEIPEFL